jgi:predicted MFS family arabinose efflux permease
MLKRTIDAGNVPWITVRQERFSRLRKTSLPRRSESFRARENLRLLGERNFAPYFYGNLIANSGTWFLTLAAGILIYRRTDSAFLLGVVGFSSFAGVLLLVPWTGTAADRFDKRRLLLVTQGAASVIAAGLTAVVMTGHDTTAVVILFVLAIGLVQAFTWPALQAIIPDLVSPEQVGSAIALKSLTHNLARGLGPACATLVIATAGIEWAFLVNAVAYLALVVGMLMVHPTPPSAAPGERPKFRASIAIVRERPRLAGLMLVSAVISVAIDPVNTLSPAFAASVWDRSDALAGVLLGAFSVGALSAALTVAGRPGHIRRQVIGRVSLLICAMVAFALAPTLELGLVALVFAGFGFLAASTSAIRELQLSIEPGHRGRIMALWSAAFVGVRPLAALIDGTIAEAAGARVSALVMVLPAVVLVVVLLVRARREANHEAAGEAGGANAEPATPGLTAEW